MTQPSCFNRSIAHRPSLGQRTLLGRRSRRPIVPRRGGDGKRVHGTWTTPERQSGASLRIITQLDSDFHLVSWKILERQLKVALEANVTVFFRQNCRQALTANGERDRLNVIETVHSKLTDRPRLVVVIFKHVSQGFGADEFHCPFRFRGVKHVTMSTIGDHSVELKLGYV